MDNKKLKTPEKRLSYQRAMQKLKEQSRENDYVITKGDPFSMANFRFWVIRDYYAALEQILKDSDRAEALNKKIK